jgi:nucleoid-associated protein YgaU
MGLFSFLKKAGSKVLKYEAKKNVEAKADTDLAQKNKILLLESLVNSMNLPIKDFGIDLKKTTVVAYGQAKNQEAKEKAILALGNVAGVSAVDDRISVLVEEPAAEFYEVKKGDSLSKIAKKYYGNPMKYMVIFQANQPLLMDPNKIYPGQVLRIPKV